jgi:hypothetical protein
MPKSKRNRIGTQSQHVYYCYISHSSTFLIDYFLSLSLSLVLSTQLPSRKPKKRGLKENVSSLNKSNNVSNILLIYTLLKWIIWEMRYSKTFARCGKTAGLFLFSFSLKHIVSASLCTRSFSGLYHLMWCEQTLIGLGFSLARIKWWRSHWGRLQKKKRNPISTKWLKSVIFSFPCAFEFSSSM